MGSKANTHQVDRRTGKQQRGKWAHFSYASRMTIAFAAIAALTALVTIGVLSFVWEQHFKTYTSDNMSTVAQQVALQVAAEYEKADAWTDAAKEPARWASTYYGTRIEIYRTNTTEAPPNQAFYDSGMVNFGTNKPPQLAPPGNSSTIVTDIVIVDPKTNEEESIGYVRVWVYGSDTLLKGADEKFRENSYEAMIFSTIIAIVLAMCIGFLFSRNLTRPINRMIRTAEDIMEGDMSARTKLKGDDEVARLGETFDAMADAVEKDRELERRLTTDVAHELRTPLMAIQSTVEAMVDGVFEADTERLETVNSEVQRLSRLVDALLRLSRLENRSTPMKEEIVNVGDLIAGIIATHEAFVNESGLSMDFRADEEVYVYGDADMIRQATANLISNAVRYTPEGGHIAVRVKRGDIMASIAVQDTGIGLTPEEAKMVFSRFWRADAGRNREYGGLGVGLAVVKEIVDRHGGWVQVEGKPNQGATFTIYIPLYNEDVVRNKMRNKEKKAKRP